MFADFTRAPYKLPKWAFILGIIVSALFGVGCLTQTELFVRWLTPPAEDSLKDHIAKSQKMQAKVASASTVTPQEQRIVIRYCSTLQQNMVAEAYAFVMSDADAQRWFFDRFQTSLKDVKVIVLYSWKLTESDYLEDSGITRGEGWNAFLEADNDPSVSATTIREKPDGKGVKTLTGTPVIILKPQAFASPQSIRFYLFHELVHALNIPAYRHTVNDALKIPAYRDPVNVPVIGTLVLTRDQTDLAYLQEYQWFVAKHGLRSMDSYTYEFFATLLLGICGLLIVRLSFRSATTTTARVYVFLRVATENFWLRSKHRAGKK